MTLGITQSRRLTYGCPYKVSTEETNLQHRMFLQYLVIFPPIRTVPCCSSCSFHREQVVFFRQHRPTQRTERPLWMSTPPAGVPCSHPGRRHCAYSQLVNTRNRKASNRHVREAAAEYDKRENIVSKPPNDVPGAPGPAGATG